MSEMLHVIDEPGAHIIEASASGLAVKEMVRLFFGAGTHSIRNRTAELGEDLRLSTKLSELELRTRATAMAIVGELLKEKDLKRPGKKYIPTMSLSGGTRISAEKIRENPLVP